MRILAMIMAGGVGTRFWPKSRKAHPKQLLQMFSDKTLIQDTVSRLASIINYSDVFVVTTAEQQKGICEQLPEIPAQNLILEPMGKNTAACIGLGALFLERIDPQAVMVVLPADHLIGDAALFQKTLQIGSQVADSSAGIVTIGIEPTYPATGYGYVQCEKSLDTVNGIELLSVKTFAEKPNMATAERFLKSGDFLWNSGMFLWKVSTILREIEEHMPHLYQGLEEIRAAIGTAHEAEVIDRVYRQVKSISIDYGVMEQANNVKVLRGQFMWNDLGSWEAVYELKEKDDDRNVLIGQHLIRDSEGCLVDSPNKCVALVGVQDMIVVDTEDAILICPREKAQNVKDIVDLAKRKKLDQYL